MLKPSHKTKSLKVSRRPTWSQENEVAKSTGLKSVATENAEEEDVSNVLGPKSDANTDEAKPDGTTTSRKQIGPSNKSQNVRHAMREQKRIAKEQQAALADASVSADSGRSFSDMRMTILNRTEVGHAGKIKPSDASTARQSERS